MPHVAPFDVFLSHSSHDKPVVRALAERLKQDGLRVWFDEWAILAGDPIFAKVEEGLENSRTLIFCMSAHAFGSDYELGRLNHDGTLTPRGDKPGSADSLRNRLRQMDTVEKRRGNGWPKVRFGLVLCGQKLAANNAARVVKTALDLAGLYGSKQDGGASG